MMVCARWTAVVRGAVIFGIEKSSHSNITIMKSCEKSYGLKLDHQFTGRTHDRRDHYEDTMTGHVMAKGQLTWLIRRGDLVLSDVPKVVEKVIAFNFMRADDRNFALPVYEYSDDDIPDRFETAQEGKCNSRIALLLLRPRKNSVKLACFYATLLDFQ
jgi:hypothetical protein